MEKTGCPQRRLLTPLDFPSREDFAALLKESLEANEPRGGRIVSGQVIKVEGDWVVIDVGMKTEGRVPLRQFAGAKSSLAPGDKVEVYLERVVNALGEAVMSHDRVRQERAWAHLEESFVQKKDVQGMITARIKGGFTVDVDGIAAFLPGSQVDVHPVYDPLQIFNTPMAFQILKMDRRRNNIVVSRRCVLETARAAHRSKLVDTLAEGQTHEGVVKNITEYGAFVDLGGVDGLLHVTDMAWRRINHPGEVLKVGEKIMVQVTKIHEETGRISLGMKQLEHDPWEGVAAKYPQGAKVMGLVTKITDYGAFIELEPGVEGLVHVSEMSWVRKHLPPAKIISTSQEVEVVVLGVDSAKRRVSLGIKQCQENPWEKFERTHKVGCALKGVVKNVASFGLFIDLGDDLSGMVHASDLSWTVSGEEALKGYKKGQILEVCVLDVDVEKEQISLGFKQLEKGFLEKMGDVKVGEAVTCTLTQVRESGVEVILGDGPLSSFIRREELSQVRSGQVPERFAVGQRVDALITKFDPISCKIELSIRALERKEEQEAVKQYGSRDSGASLGDVLAPTLKGEGEGADS